jgi:hypothetical protein
VLIRSLCNQTRGVEAATYRAALRASDNDGVANGKENPSAALLRAALADAGVNEAASVLVLVAGAPPADAVEYAYLPPGDWGDLENRVLHDARDCLHEFGSLHRFGMYAELDAPTAATAVGLRHEAQHAAQYDQFGRKLFELESILRRAMRRAGRMDDYPQIPSEREANRAAGTYARARYAESVDALAADDRFRQFVEEPAAVADLLEETVEMIWQYVSPDDVDDQDDDCRTFGIVVPELKQAVLAWVPMDPRHQPARDRETPLLAEWPAS